MNGDKSRAMALHLVEEELTARRYASGSRIVRVRAVKAFMRWASQRGSVDLGRIRPRDLLSYRAYLSRRPSRRTGELLSPSFIIANIHGVRLLFSCLYRAGLIADNPAQNLAPPRESPVYARRPLTRAEISRVLESIATDTQKGRRDRALYELIYSSGLRVSEAAGLKVGDIDFERRLMVVRGKFDRDRMVPISEVAHDFLSAYLGERIGSAEAWVFPGYSGHLSSMYISERFRAFLRRLGMDAKDISTHSIRHSTATHLLENGASIRHVQELLGHACIESTVRYTQLMVDGLAAIHRKYHPREHDLFQALDEGYEKRLARLA